MGRALVLYCCLGIRRHFLLFKSYMIAVVAYIGTNIVSEFTIDLNLWSRISNGETVILMIPTWVQPSRLGEELEQM